MLALVALGACSSPPMTAEECRLSDWRAIGYEDGAAGRTSASFGWRRKACAEHEVAADFNAYLNGHEEGTALFCRPENGYRLGADGYRYTGVCPAGLEGAFLTAHADGYGLYERKAALDDARSRLNYSRQRSRDIEYIIADRTTAMVSPLTLPTDRAAIAIEIKQLTEEKFAIEDSIPRLEYEVAEAEREYQTYRQSVAARY